MTYTPARIDSTQKRIDEGKPIQHFTPRRKRSNWCEQNLVRCHRRIKVDRIQHYQHTNRPEYGQKTLQKFIEDCHNGKMQAGWSDFGRLEER